MVLDALDRYAATLARAGGAPSDIDPDAAGRSDPDGGDVRAQLRAAGIRPAQQVVDYFTWTQRVGGSLQFVDLDASSLTVALAIRDELRAVAAEVAGHLDGATPDDIVPVTWVPLGPSDPPLVADTAIDPPRVLAVWWDQPPSVIAPSIAAFVEDQRRQLADGAAVVEGGRPVMRRAPIARPTAVVRFAMGDTDLHPSAQVDVDVAARAAAADPEAPVLVRHHGAGDIARNDGVELAQLATTIAALVAAGVDRRRIDTETAPRPDHDGLTLHNLAVIVGDGGRSAT